MRCSVVSVTVHPNRGAASCGREQLCVMCVLYHDVQRPMQTRRMRMAMVGVDYFCNFVCPSLSVQVVV